MVRQLRRHRDYGPGRRVWAALERYEIRRDWATHEIRHVLPEELVFAVDRQVGGLLLEATEPGAALDQTGTFPDVEAVAELVTGLHRGRPGRSACSGHGPDYALA